MKHAIPHKGTLEVEAEEDSHGERCWIVSMIETDSGVRHRAMFFGLTARADALEWVRVRWCVVLK